MIAAGIPQQGRSDCEERYEVKGVCRRVAPELMEQFVHVNKVLDAHDDVIKDKSKVLFCVDALYTMPIVGKNGKITDGKFPKKYERDSWCEADGKTPRKLSCLGTNSKAENETLRYGRRYCGPGKDGYVETMAICGDGAKEGDSCGCTVGGYFNSAGSCQDATHNGKPVGQICSRGGAGMDLFGNTQGLKSVGIACPLDKKSNTTPGDTGDKTPGE